MNHEDWSDLGDGLMARLTGPHVDGELDCEVMVSNIGNATDDDVRLELQAFFGDDWKRQSEWSAADGEPDVTSRWMRVQQ